MKDNKLSLRIIQAALIVVFGLSSYIIWSLLRPYNPVDILEPIKVSNHVVKKGEPVVLEISSCTRKETNARVEIELHGDNNSGVGIPIITLNNIPTKIGCQNDMKMPIPTSQIPFALPSGKYNIRLHATYQVNNFRSVSENYDSEVFEYVNE